MKNNIRLARVAMTMLLVLMLTAVQTAWAHQDDEEPTHVTLSEDAGNNFVNMPKSGNAKLELDGTATSFHVYDDGDNGGYYSNDCDGTLTITAPEGYILQISGNVTAEGNSYDYLQYHEGTSTDFDNDTQYGNKDGEELNFKSGGQSVTLHFKSNNSGTYSGIDLTVTLVPSPSITVQPSDLTLEYGYEENNTLSIEATSPEDFSLSYQWYSNTSASTEGGTAIDEATENTYNVPQNKNSGVTEYYYCVVTAANNNDATQTATATSSIATVKITDKKIQDYSALTIYENQNGQIAVLDGEYNGKYPMDIEEDIFVNSIIFNRTFKANVTATVILPFDFYAKKIQRHVPHPRIRNIQWRSMDSNAVGPY